VLNNAAMHKIYFPDSMWLEPTPCMFYALWFDPSCPHGTRFVYNLDSLHVYSSCCALYSTTRGFIFVYPPSDLFYSFYSSLLLSICRSHISLSFHAYLLMALYAVYLLRSFFDPVRSSSLFIRYPCWAGDVDRRSAFISVYTAQDEMGEPSRFFPSLC
jgi:hypothetical protein